MKKILCMVLCLCLLIPAMVCAERKVVTAVAAEINPDNLKSVLVDARIRAYSKEDSTITVDIITPELYDPEEIKSLAEGDGIYTQGHEMTVESINHYDTFLTIVSGEEVLTLFTDMEPYGSYDGDFPLWTTLATVTVPVYDDVIYLDDVDPATGDSLPLPTVHSAEEFRSGLAADDAEKPAFAANYYTMVFNSEGNLIEVRRQYVNTNWQ